jgi:hypothetical protein
MARGYSQSQSEASGRSDKAALRLAIKSHNEGETYRYRRIDVRGKGLNKYSEDELRTTVSSHIFNSQYHDKWTDAAGNKIDVKKEVARLEVEAEENHRKEAEAYGKRTGNSGMSAYDDTSGESSRQIGYTTIGNQKFSFEWTVESYVTTEDDGDRSPYSYQHASPKIYQDTIKQV